MRRSTDNDVTDGVFDFLRDLTDFVKEEFNKLLAGDNDKKKLSGHCQEYLLCY